MAGRPSFSADQTSFGEPNLFLVGAAIAKRITLDRE
jgi:hypothetical protein